MKVLVCGGRYFLNMQMINDVLGAYHTEVPITLLVEGGARGADRLARKWAAINNVQCVTYKADWDTFGKSAGPIRNIQMLETERPDIVFAFPGGKGTQHMVNIAKKKGVRVIECSPVAEDASYVTANLWDLI
jgi:hypothetical protein